MAATPAVSGAPKPAKPALPPYSEIVARVIALEAGLAASEAVNADQDRRIADLEAENADQARRIADLERLLRNFSLVDVDPALDDDLGNPEETVRVSGANLQVVNGLGTTDSEAGLGNVVIGYNATRFPRHPPDQRNGSHNLIVGDRNNYESYGGIVAGFRLTSGAPYCSLIGGEGSVASSSFATVIGGFGNAAYGLYSVITGGTANKTHGSYSSISGGEWNYVQGTSSSISGGLRINLLAPYAWAGGYLTSP